MSVSSTTTKNSYSGDGSTVAFAYAFKIFADADLEVIIRASAGTETTKTLTTHYTVSGAGSDSGGTGTFTTGNTPASGETVVIRRKLTLTQGTDYVENDPFPANSHEDGLDRLTFIAQGIQEELDRSFKVSKTNSITTPEFTDDASTRASKLLGFSSDGNNLEATTGRVSSVSVSNVAVSGGASQDATVSFNTTTGALALGIPVGSTGATGATGSAGSDGVFSAIASQTSCSIATTQHLSGVAIAATNYTISQKPKSTLHDTHWGAANIYGVDEGEVGVARTTAYSVAHGGWVGLTTYNDCDGNLRVKSEVLVAMSGISTGSAAYGAAGDAADDTFFGDA